ncbi:MAG TPA: hypothetical protein VFO16_23715 [Pseudonocardiaceae bacterium]|nr:hypothetical protein [Pseudonocardiaceae bacterium]
MGDRRASFLAGLSSAVRTRQVSDFDADIAQLSVRFQGFTNEGAAMDRLRPRRHLDPAPPGALGTRHRQGIGQTIWFRRTPLAIALTHYP